MSKEISTSIRIDARPEKVWAILTEFKNYPSWNPFIVSLTGEVAVGKNIKAIIHPPGGSRMTFTPIVLAFEPNKHFRWKGKLFLPGLFDGEHIFELDDNGDGSTTFIQRELFSGILVPLFRSMLDNQTLNGFNQMNQKLKELAEQPSPTA